MDLTSLSGVFSGPCWGTANTQDPFGQGRFFGTLWETCSGRFGMRKRVTVVKFTVHLPPNWVPKRRAFRDAFWERWGVSGNSFWTSFWMSFWTSFGFILDIILETLAGTLLGRLGAPLTGQSKSRPPKHGLLPRRGGHFGQLSQNAENGFPKPWEKGCLKQIMQDHARSRK